MAVDLETSISTVSIVLFIAAGALFFVLAFILAKRQIMRFASKSSRHPIGAGAPKKLKKEIFEKLEMTKSVRFEPLLLSPTVLHTATTVPNHYLYRMKAVDAFSKFDELVEDKERRHPNQPMRRYLIGLYYDLLNSTSLDVVKEFCDAYEHARHDPEEFGESQYDRYIQLLQELISSLKTGLNKRNKAYPTSPSNPCHTEVNFRDGQTKTFVSSKSDKDVKHSVSGDVRFRSCTGSSGHSSLLQDSGHSSQPSSELTDKGSTEKIALVQLSDIPSKGDFV